VRRSRPLVERLLAVAFAVLAVQVLVLERSTTGNHVTPIVPSSVPFDGSIATVAARTDPERYSDLLLLSERFAGSRIFESELRPEHRWSRGLLGGVGHAEQVAHEALHDEVPGVAVAPIQQTGTSRRGDWTILATEPGARDFLYVSVSPTEYAYIDYALIPASPTAHAVMRFPTVRDYGGLLVPLKEWGVFALLLGLGLVLLRGTSLDGSVRPWVAFPTGVTALAAMGIFLPRGVSGLGLALLLGASLVVFRVAAGERVGIRSAIGLDACSIGQLGVATVTLGAVPALARRFRLTFVTPDSFDYLGGAYVLGLGQGSFTSDAFDTSFFIGQQAIHAAGYALGIGPLYSLGWALLACMIAVLAHLGKDSWFGAVVGDRALAAVVIGALAGISPYVWRFAAYVNSHLFVAALLLVLFLVIADSAASQRLHLGLALLLFSAFVFMRGEAPLVIALMLLGLSRHTLERDRVRYGDLWLALAAANLAWAVLVVRLAPSGAGFPRSALLSAAMGVAFIVAWGFARSSIGGRYIAGFWTVPWLALGALHLVVRDRLPEGLVLPLRAVRDNLLNLGSGAGVLPLLMMLLAAALVVERRASESPEFAAVRTLLLGYLPAVLFARAVAPTAWTSVPLGDLQGDFISRAGFGDSTNRALFHLWFIVVAAFLSGSGRIRVTRGWTASAGPVSFVILLTVLAQQWLAELAPAQHRYRLLGWALVALLGALMLLRSTHSRQRCVDDLGEASDSGSDAVDLSDRS